MLIGRSGEDGRVKRHFRLRRPPPLHRPLVALDVHYTVMSPPAASAEPLALPNELPKVQELGVTSGPLKSAAFFLGAFCKDYNGS